ncbi:sensor histidine kinase [Bacteroides sp.]|uniref:sensor histidine kinase n=1 Tax=Bacteroides sp. TaxID=29523 RepID=UPI00260AF4C0|nr:histidine kinase [Bacteroides sp.]MDD3037844.1 histidine kinase [Bacteroides sp.]
MNHRIVDSREQIDRSITAFLLSPRYRIYRQLALQAVVLLITVNIFWYEPLQNVSFGRRFLGWLAYFTSLNMVIYANLYLLVPRFLLKNRLGKYFLGAIAVNMVVIFYLSVSQGLLFEVIIPGKNPDGFAVFINTFSGILTIGFITMGTTALLLFSHWLRYNLRVDELESTTLESELKYLKRQINPHFLFNMLNNANVLIKRNPEEASKVLFKLEDLLRYQINDSSREIVSLASDIRFLNDYLNLEKIRRDHFQFTLEQEGDIESIWIQPLLFIPFVENAVKYSFDSEQPSYVHLSFKVDDRMLKFYCENSIPAVSVSNSKVGGIGLANIRRRLQLLYPDRYEWKQKENENQYTVILSIIL